MQIQSSETVAGTTICWAPSRMAGSISLPCSRCQLMFSMVTVASSTRIPTASASPPSVMTLMVSPNSERPVSAARIASGIESVMIRVERQLPRNNRIIIPVSAAAMHLGHVTHIDDGAVDRLDREVVEGCDRFRRVIQVDGIFVTADFLRSHRCDQVLQRQRVDDIVGGNAVLMQRLLIEIGLDLAHLAAEGKRQGGAWNRSQRRADEVQCRVENLGFRHLVA